MSIPFWKSLAFYKALAFVVAGVYLYFNPESLVTDLTILTLVQGVLQFFGVTPELRAKGLM